MQQLKLNYFTQTGRGLRSLILFLALILTTISAHSQPFIEDTHYSLLSHNISPPTTRLVEYFSFSCPGCYALEPIIVALRKSQPEITFQRIHMPFGGRKAKLSQKVFALLRLLHAEEHEDKVFFRIHNRHDLFDNDDEILDFFSNLGYDREKTRKLLHSFALDNLIRTMNKQAVNSKIRSVPSLVMNGKYLINLSKLSSMAELEELLNHLETLAD